MSSSLTRRALCAALAGSLGAMVAPVHAQDPWPGKPVRMIVPIGAGSAPDVIARLIADRLSQAWGQGVVVENRAGAGGIPGMSTLARSPNDGYTIGFVPAAMGTVTPLVYKSPQFSADDFVPVATVGVGPMMIVTPAGNGIHSLADLAKKAKAEPGKVNFAAPQLNSLPHLTGEMMNKLGNLGLFTVPYATPPAAINAVLAGDATVTADGMPGVVQHVKSGKLRALAVTSAQRVPGFEDVPTLAESFPGFETIGWFQIVLPKGAPAAVGERINRDVNRITQQPDVVARLAEMGIFPRPDTPAGARQFFADQQRLMKKLVTDLGITPQ